MSAGASLVSTTNPSISSHDHDLVRRKLAYIERRRAEGKTDREIRRCIKRYLARHLYRVLSTDPAPDPRTA
jgi:hypothetical protein